MYPYDPEFGQTIKTHVPGVDADRAFLAHLQWSSAEAATADDDAVHAAITLGAAAADVTTAIANPPCPRNITITGNAVGNAGNVVITGTNYLDAAITETIALNGNVLVAGAKAFKTVNKINVPIQTHAGTDTVKVGFGDKLGLPYKLDRNTVMAAYLDKVLEAVAATVTVSTTAIESNTVDLNSALDGHAVDVDLRV